MCVHETADCLYCVLKKGQAGMPLGLGHTTPHQTLTPHPLPPRPQVCARDQDSKWLTALALLDDDTFIAADNGHNLVRWCWCWCCSEEKGRG